MTQRVAEKCVVLNNLYKERVDRDIAVSANDRDKEFLYQPYATGKLVGLHSTMPDSAPLPIFMVCGQFGEQIRAMGLLHSLQFNEDLSPDAREHLLTLVDSGDQGLYAINLLIITNLLPVRPGLLSVEKFIKMNGGTPLKPGQWTASICFTPPLATILAAL